MAAAQASSDAAAMAAPPLIASDIGIGSVEIDASDVVRLVLQFLKEHGLSSSAAELERESGVLVNAVEAKGRLVGDVRSGSRARGDARAPAPQDAPEARGAEPERFLRLERAVGRAAATGGYGGEAPWPRGETRESRRAAVADDVAGAVGAVAPGRLVSLLGMALRWQAHCGDLRGSGGRRVDVFRGDAGDPLSRKSEEERPPKRAAGAVRLGAGSKPLCCAFAPDGSALITGSSDGFVELWDPASCRLRTDLPYQRDDELLMHDAPSSRWRRRSTARRSRAATATGASRSGAWPRAVREVPKGAAAGRERRGGRKVIQRRFNVSAVAWSRDGSQLLTASSDGAVRSHGLKSGRTLQQFRGHGGSVSAVAYLRSSGESSDAVVSGSADGTQPGSESKFFVVDKSPTAVLADLRTGVAVAAFSSRDEPAKPPSEAAHALRKPGCDFVAAALSRPRGDYLYCLGEDKVLYCFHVQSAALDRCCPIDDAKDVVGLAVHPHRNAVAPFGDGALL
ncbi:hypothetical protein JL720_4308 [Aureococcus anophagefferens]|nr:hypothetical protein JL720_4308 [Aureococcus anophagefferens]